MDHIYNNYLFIKKKLTFYYQSDIYYESVFKEWKENDTKIEVSEDPPESLIKLKARSTPWFSPHGRPPPSFLMDRLDFHPVGTADGIL